MPFLHDIAINKQVSIGDSNRAFIIAELGINHNGSPETAREMVDAAVESGADAVKFQTFRTEEFLSDRDVTYSYEWHGNEVTENMYEMFKKVELEYDSYQMLFSYAISKGIIPFTSIADSISFDYLTKFEIPLIKIASEDIINIDLLRYIKHTKVPLIISTGMADEHEIANALEILENKEDIVLLHCVSLYPTPLEKLNLKRMIGLRNRFGTITGFSDHSKSLISGGAAVAMGARVIEKHFTLDTGQKGPDHAISLNPDDFSRYVSNIRETESMCGSEIIEPSSEEKEMAILFRRGITAAVHISKGEILTADMLSFKRPCPGLKPYEIEEVIGKTIYCDKEPGDKIIREDLNQS